MPYIWLDATYVKCRREGHVSSTAIVTAIGCDADGWRHILGLAVVDTESYSSWKGFLERIRARGRGRRPAGHERCP
jgi:transposase-like protein